MENNKSNPILGIIGGSGVYEFDGLTNTHWKKISSPFGEPSDSLLFGEFNGQQLIFLPRHGRGHRIPPSKINFRANIDVLKRAGVTDVISVSAVGSLREHLRPGMFVVVDQFIDRTFAREKSFFGTGLVAHISMAHPVCHRLGDHVANAAEEVGIEVARGGTYLVMEGPQFSTLAESELYRTWNCDVIGMTNMPEAKLAREAEICYATVAMVTDYDCWHPNHDDVTVDAIVRILQANADNARSLVKTIVPRIRADRQAHDCSCRSALASALITSPDERDPALVKKLDAVAERVLSTH
uniref:S-methyl-5'-thioadenosine phosphorylase n=1 Tax=Candidatus Kentrum sp. FM TaxID=2126340 RepID=A0A450RYS0_9GAMM|nr:MAG: 5'-methylthioadenosine phosphorylase [Candidatus Kentron sp. FM]VFJ57550.1 MAG: 5'-methylthioadenosine phosphorylase [Candidatus Kentron sp. FM]VFK06587.1 MAG: 5'-methylthioadenosine phosphorylase [Candidatus Kentron sp. FM]